jgi:hypothetical protein
MKSSCKTLFDSIKDAHMQDAKDENRSILRPESSQRTVIILDLWDGFGQQLRPQILNIAEAIYECSSLREMNPGISVTWESNITLKCKWLEIGNNIPRYGPEYLYELDQKRAPSMKVKNGPTKDDLKKKNPGTIHSARSHHLIVDYTSTEIDLE